MQFQLAEARNLIRQARFEAEGRIEEGRPVTETSYKKCLAGLQDIRSEVEALMRILHKIPTS